MSRDPDSALQMAILAKLAAQTSLQPLLGNPPRVYDEPPPEPVYPFVTLGTSQTRPYGGLVEPVSAEATEHAISLTIASVSGGTEEVKTVLSLVRAALHGAALSLEDHRLINLRVTFGDVFRAADWRSTYGVLRLRAVTEPTNS
jgi:hypothetical protein